MSYVGTAARCAGASWLVPTFTSREALGPFKVLLALVRLPGLATCLAEHLLTCMGGSYVALLAPRSASSSRRFLSRMPMACWLPDAAMVMFPRPRPVSGFCQAYVAACRIEAEKLAVGGGVEIPILESHVDEITI
jgi:hypothetical protein